MNQDYMVLYVVCWVMFFCNNDIYSYKQSHVAELGFQILASMENWHPLNLLISKHSCLKEQSLINSKFSKALVSSIEAHHCKSQVTFLIAILWLDLAFKWKSNYNDKLEERIKLKTPPKELVLKE